MFSIITTQRFALFWRLAKGWFTNLADAVVLRVTTAIGAKIDNIDPYVELSDNDFNNVFAEGEQETPTPTPEPEQEPEYPQEDNRPMIEAYNENLDVRITLRRTKVQDPMAIWEDGQENEWYTDYPYSIGGNVWNTEPSEQTPAWGVISLISE